MRRSATDRDQRHSLGNFVDGPQTASTPELPSGFMSTLLDFDGRPRSWSSNMSQKEHSQMSPTSPATGYAGTVPPHFTRSLRSASIRSSATRGGLGNTDELLDGMATQSRPQVATTLASDPRRIEARGRIVSPDSRPASASSMAPSGRKQALCMMKPLVAASGPDGGRSSDPNSATASTTVTPRNSTRTCSKSSSGSSINNDGSDIPHTKQNHPGPGTASSSLPHDLTSIQFSTAPRTQPGTKARPATKTTLVSNDGIQIQRPTTADRSQSSSLWAAISRLSLGSSANASQSSLDTGAATRRSAVDHLKEIERKQPIEHVANSLDQQLQSNPDTCTAESSELTYSAMPIENGTDTKETNQRPEPTDAASITSGKAINDDVKSKTDSKHEESPRSSKWLQWWSSRNSQPENLVQADSDAVAKGTLATAESSSEQAPAISAVAAAQHRLPPNASAKSMLLPDFDVGSDKFSADMLPERRLPVSMNTSSASPESHSANKHARTDTESDVFPLHKRLRLLGQAVVSSAIDMAPSWARTVLQGQRVADAQGQVNGSDYRDTLPTADQLASLMDNSASRLGKIAIIGVHGWFPMRMLQMLAGEPTGKSEKFCLMMRDALKAYLEESHQVAIADSDISLFPLIGEGRIEDRVELLLAQILDAEAAESSRREQQAAATAAVAATSGDSKVAAEEADNRNPSGKLSEQAAEALMPERSQRAQVLRDADTVFVVTHSQGTPVSAMIIERLMELGLIDTDRQRVAMLAMAGISHGPLAHLKDNVVVKYIESGTARELFELMDPSSYQSQRYVAALSTILHHGVRLVCVGSWVDEAVPLYSAILQGVSHPNVYRAVYIDAPHYSDDFLTGLIVFALRLRNMGIYDHDLLIHLSEVVAGSLWGHWGHSTVYGEPAVYKLAVKWLLYSTSATSCASASESVPADARHAHGNGASGPQIHMSYRPFNATEPLNPFYIPWIMRTLWDEPEIQNNHSLRSELQRLVALFDKWAPETKPAKELRYRLEPVRAAL
ncbi:hypothetical protein IWW36_003660 [Coemansia brasiliensis]|uniref:YMC020W-like alpha/beta hydrolase domain-containing protein n=1 Tax=Coemansia brasiliensis TaxID=2650707 RepID=A0A9W8LWZ9_9FUNG|nr:hypothetical protein IWW36_003660 [Coemansia brasiliensis]